jgi:hypothetical protein
MTRPLKYGLLLAAALAASGCAGQNVYLVGRTTGITAQNKFRIVHPGGDVSFTIDNEVYTGRWGLRPLFIVNPLSGVRMDNLFSTHPSTENHIAAREELAGARAA